MFPTLAPRWVALALASALIGVGVGGSGDSARANPEPERPECRIHEFEVRKYEKKQPYYQARAVAASEPITRIPEFHDCQRFLSSDGTRFDSMYAIFAARTLKSLPDLLERPVQTNQPGPVTNPRQWAMTAATIYSYGGRYAPLGIEPGFNCLYLWLDGAREWRAFMFPVEDRDPDCLQRRTASGRGVRPLRVNVTLRGVFPDSEYPPVARWDLDPRRKLHFIGIKCGDAWCEVGPSGASFGSGARRTDLAPLLASTRHGHKRVTSVKGWHDQQWIAIPPDPGAVPTVGPKLRPFTAFAAVYPDTLLERRTVADFSASRWIPVATVVLDQDIPGYERKLNFTQGTNTIFLQNTSTGWRARIVSGRKVARERDVVRRDHSAMLATLGLTVPGTARWRWRVDDETIWIRCDAGCCEIAGDTF